LEVITNRTLGVAFIEGLRPHVRCLRGKRSGPVKTEPCGYAANLSLETLIWTRGAAFPVWRLASRLKCPRCGGTRMAVEWQPGARAPGHDLVQCERAMQIYRGRLADR
jgi:hypothetical protein